MSKYLTLTTDAGMFRDLMKVTELLNDEIFTFRADPNGIRVRDMDSSHVFMMDYFFNSFNMKKYDCEEKHDFRINGKDLMKTLRRIHDSESLEISVDREIMILSAKGEMSKTFYIDVIDDYVEKGISKLVGIPKINVPTKIEIDVDSFKKALDAVSIFRDHVTFSSHERGKTILTLSSEANNKLKWDSDIVGKTIIKMKEPMVKTVLRRDSHSTYGIEWILPFLRKIPDARITIEYDRKMPIILTSDYIIPNLKMWLAPRIEEEE